MTDRAPEQATKILPPGRRDRAPRSDTGRSRKKNLTKPLTEFFTTIGTVVAVANQTDGIAIIDGAERLAESLNAVAKDNPTIYRNLERMLTGSNWGGVIVASGAIILPIMANHNLLPFTIPGLTPADKEPNTGGVWTEIPDISNAHVTGE